MVNFFAFTSPQDDHIGKAEFLEKRFPPAGRPPAADRLSAQEILR